MICSYALDSAVYSLPVGYSIPWLYKVVLHC